MLVARDLMERDPLTVPATMPILEVQHLFVVVGVHGAPVIDERGAVVGVVSITDLLRAADQAADEDRDEGEERAADAQGAVLEIATPQAIWVSPEMPVDRVARLMHHEGVHRVLVGVDGRLEGILTAFDLLRAVQAETP